MARRRSSLEPKWYWIAELFDEPASMQICRNEIPARPCSANSRSAVRSSCSAVAGGGPVMAFTMRSLRTWLHLIVEMHGVDGGRRHLKERGRACFHQGGEDADVLGEKGPSQLGHHSEAASRIGDDLGRIAAGATG